MTSTGLMLQLYISRVISKSCHHWAPGRDFLNTHSLRKLLWQIQVDQYQILRMLAKIKGGGVRDDAWSAEKESINI